MGLAAWRICFVLRSFIDREQGQDLVEYALIVALVTLAATAGMDFLASAINMAFSKLGSILGTYT